MNVKTDQRTPPAISGFPNVPPLLDAKGVRTYIAPVGRTLLYQAAASGEIESVSLGMGKKGKRLFITESIVAWINRRAVTTEKPKMGANKSSPLSPEVPQN